MKRYIFRNLIPLLAYCGLIFYLSHQESLPAAPFFLFEGEDKLAHALEYGLLGVLITRCLTPWDVNSLTPYISIFLGTLYAVSDEFHQSFVPGRHADVADVVADFIGLTVAVFLFFKASTRDRDFVS